MERESLNIKQILSDKDSAIVIESKLKYTPKKSMSILKPVTICMLITIFLVYQTNKARGIDTNREFSLNNDGFKLKFQSLSNKDQSIDLKQSILISFLFLLGLITSTLFILAIVYLNSIKLLLFLLSFTLFILFIFVNSFFCFTLFTSFDIKLDLITCEFLIINNSVLAYVSIMQKSCKILTQFYHIYLSILLAWYLDFLTSTYIGWSILVLLSAWDLIAVLPKQGPLNLIIKQLDKKGLSLPNALIYSTWLDWKLFRNENSLNKNNNNSLDADQKVKMILKSFVNTENNYVTKDEREEEVEIDDEGPKLGIGDFVFYSLLIAKTANQFNLFTIMCCVLTILIGLIMTMLLVATLSRPLPALPISIFLSILIFFLSESTIVPFSNRLTLRQIFI